MSLRVFSTTISQFILLFCLAAIAQEDERAFELNEATYSKIREAILLHPSEAEWEQIPWQPDLGEAVRKAHKIDQPILLWMMNGHPAGMT